MIWLTLQEYEDEKEYYHYKEIHKMTEQPVERENPRLVLSCPDYSREWWSKMVRNFKKDSDLKNKALNE